MFDRRRSRSAALIRQAVTGSAVVSIGGVGSVSHVINGTGPGVDSGTINAYMVSYP